MDESVSKKLLDINDKFYQSFGAAFAETRHRIQPGVQRIVEEWIKPGTWLDIGCGSGVLGQRLAQSGLQGSYLGLDFSEPLLAEARLGAEALPAHDGFELTYRPSNLMHPNWSDGLQSNTFDGILAFAVFHHLPGAEKRRRLLSQIYNLLKPGGIFIHSEWQFDRNPKLAARVQPWSMAGLSADEVEPGDFLLDWRHYTAGQTDEPGLRYVHLFTESEFQELAVSTGFTILEQFDSDGKTGNLGLYQVCQKTA
ncbi:MAG: class I SAM-dependent methyltransferase [Anaerolineae bacterium]|nr:class I SAM-dependent methyltransferase [Anaerolineae bacterium]